MRIMFSVAQLNLTVITELVSSSLGEVKATKMIRVSDLILCIPVKLNIFLQQRACLFPLAPTTSK
jgi:hypothetical protein